MVADASPATLVSAQETKVDAAIESESGARRAEVPVEDVETLARMNVWRERLAGKSRARGIGPRRSRGPFAGLVLAD